MAAHTLSVFFSFKSYGLSMDILECCFDNVKNMALQIYFKPKRQVTQSTLIEDCLHKVTPNV
jgi:hypothetical protein